MKTLWRYLRPLRKWVFLSLLLAAVGQVLDLVDPLILGRIIDEYALNPAGRPESELVRGVLGWLALAVGVALVARLAKSLQDYVLTYVVQSSGMQLFNDGLRQTLRLTYQEYEDSSSGETVALLQKVRNDTERFINAAVNILFSTVVGMGFLIWYAITRHWLLIPVFVIGVLVLGGLTGLLSQKIRTTQRAIVRQTRTMYGTMTESLRNIELVKSLGLTFPEIRRMQGYTQGIFDLEMEKVRRVRSLTYLQGAIINVLKQSILFILLWLIFRSVLSPGELVSLQVIINTIFGPLQQMGGFILQYREAEASLQLFEQLMQKPVERRPDEPVEIGALESLRFEDVVFRHKSAEQNAIDGISFRAALGDTIAFVGPSGSGKSTLVKLLVGLYRPIEGVITIDNVPANELRYNRVRRQIGFRDPGRATLLRQHPREPAIREARRDRRRDAGGAGEGVGDGHCGARAERAGQPAGRGGHARVGRRAPAHLHCPRPVARPAAAHLRRGHLGARLADGEGHHRRHPLHLAGARAYRHPHRPPSEHHRPRRHHLRPGEGAHRGDGDARGVAGATGVVLRDVAAAGGGAGGE
jgi:ATP-binding cassette subfamily B protein